MADRVDVGAFRRAQIVEAATRIIARKGFHNATLAEVESEAGISRGMMTYHFPTKDAMVLAVFDSLIDRLRETTARHLRARTPRGRERIERLIDAMIVEHPPDGEFQSLLYTFLAQLAHRDDYRQRLAALYAALRDDIAAVLREAQCHGDPHDLASLLVASFHGLAVQLSADPHGLEPSRLAAALKTLLAPLFPPAPGGSHVPPSDQMV